MDEDNIEELDIALIILIILGLICIGELQILKAFLYNPQMVIDLLSLWQ